MDSLMKPSLCGCFVHSSPGELSRALHHPSLSLLEWRLDIFLAANSMKKTLEALELLREPRRLPVLATNRPTREGGLFSGPEEERVRVLEKAVEAGAEWVDLEMDVNPEFVARFQSRGTQVLISHHDFTSTPGDRVLRKWAGQMALSHPRIIKIVTQAWSPEDNLRVLGLIPWARDRLGQACVGFCMGPLGRWSRLACLLLGSPWTYVQLPGQDAAAPGQLGLDDVKLLWRFFSSDEALNTLSGLQNMERQLQQADKLASIGQLASGIAHEINNPLSLILGYTQLLLRDEQEGSERAEDLRIIEKHARACKTIVKDLLSFAREAPSNKGSGHLHACIEEVLGVVRHQFELDGIQIETVLDEAMPPMTLDGPKIKQVLMNLIMNAKQAIRDKGVIRVVTRYDHRAKLGKVQVHDRGCGIPSEQLPRIFDPFFTTKETGEGTGLGLSVSYGIVKDHGGEISVESEPGRGSTFTVSLPVVGEQQGSHEEGNHSGRR
jgi:3-dehydroquinate dehydratase type I